MSFRTPLALSLAALIASNLVPLAGAVYLGWSVFELLMLFWAENVIIGVLTVLQMGTLLVLRSEWLALFVIPFFTFHYGAFCAGHGVFVVAMFAPDALKQQGWETIARTLIDTDGILFAVVALAASHLVSFVANFVVGREYTKVDLNALMGQPYVRIILLHVTIIIGGGAAIALGQPVAALGLLAVLKIVVDAIAHVREHTKLAAAP